MEVKVETSVSVYRDSPIALFSIVYTSGLTNASIPDTSTGSHTISTFPSFVIEEIAGMNRGYVSWLRGSKYMQDSNCMFNLNCYIEYGQMM